MWPMENQVNIHTKHQLKKISPLSKERTAIIKLICTKLKTPHLAYSKHHIACSNITVVLLRDTTYVASTSKTKF